MSLIRILKMDVKDVVYLYKRFFPKPVVYTEEDKRESLKKIVVRYGRQPSLNMGRFSLSSDIEKRKEKIKGYRFI